VIDAQSQRPFLQQIRTTAGLAWQSARLVWRASPHVAAATLAVLAAQALVRPVQLFASRAVIDRVALDLGLATLADPLVLALSSNGWIAVAAGSVILGQLLLPFATVFQWVAGQRLSGHVAEQLIAAANRWRGLERFEDPRFADDLQAARSRANVVGLTLLVSASRGVLHLFTAAGAALVLAGLHPLAPPLMVLGLLPHAARQWRYNAHTAFTLYRLTPETRRLEYSRNVLLTPESGKDVRLYGLGPFFRRAYDAVFRRAMAPLDRERRQLTTQVALAATVGGVITGVIYGYVVWSVAAGQRSLGELALYGGAAVLLETNLLGLADRIGYLAQQLAFVPSLLRVLDAPPDLPAPLPPERLRPVPRPIREGIVFEHVTFGYPSGAGANGPVAPPVLRDVSFHLAPGESLALVGHNGAGKTTIVKLLLRLYDPSLPHDSLQPSPSPGTVPSAGRILLDGHDLREYDLDALRREMAVVLQDFVRFELTAGENIGLGRVEALDDRASLLAATERAGARELVEALPQGLETPVGRELGGRELSGGEWQKLALARAFMRAPEPTGPSRHAGEGGSGGGAGAQVLVLDEPTAALDVQSEYEVYRRFHDLTRGRMTLLISHRFSTVRMAHRILYLADGVIKEEGTHEALVARGGEYARLYALQAAQYR
jgi:ATP-binding cassette subfamily B protein